MLSKIRSRPTTLRGPFGGNRHRHVVYKSPEIHTHKPVTCPAIIPASRRYHEIYKCRSFLRPQQQLLFSNHIHTKMSSHTFSRQLTRNTRYRLNNGQHIPVAAFGVYDIPLSQTFDMVYEALKQGYRHIDTAVEYGNEKESAQAVAQFVKDSQGKVKREEIWYTTKIYTTDHGYEKTKRAVADIASRVKPYIEYVDMILIHTPLSNKTKRIETWKALQEFNLDPANEVLRINTIGVSNFGIAHIEELLNWDGLVVEPAVDQIELHPWLPQIELREYLVRKNILIEAYSPLTTGYKLQDPELLELEHKYKIPRAEMLLKWSYIQGFIVIVKTATKSRVKQNLAVLPDPPSPADTLDDTSNQGKIDLDINIVEALDKPNAHESVVWGSDPTKFP